MAKYSNFDLRTFLAENKNTEAKEIQKEELDLTAEENIEELDGAGSVDALTALIGAGGLAGGAVALSKLMDALEAGKLGSKGEAVAKFLRSAGKTFSGQGAPMKEETTDYVGLAKQTFDGNPQVELTHGDPNSVHSKKPMHGLSLKLALNYIRNNADAHAIENGDVFAEAGPDGVLRITIGDQEFDIKKAMGKDVNETSEELTREEAFKKEIKDLLDS